MALEQGSTRRFHASEWPMAATKHAFTTFGDEDEIRTHAGKPQWIAPLGFPRVSSNLILVAKCCECMFGSCHLFSNWLRTVTVLVDRYIVARKYYSNHICHIY